MQNNQTPSSEQLEQKKKYLDASIDALKPQGDILQIGFNFPYLATRIQEFNPRSHVIIESHPTRIQEAKAWAKGKENTVKIFEGDWKENLQKTRLGVFDLIFFDDSLRYTQVEQQMAREFDKSLKKVEKKASNTHNTLKEAFKSMKDIKFTDEQVIDFVAYLRTVEVSSDEVIDFIESLVEQGNITPQQEVRFLDEFEKEIKAKMKNSPQHIEKPDREKIDTDIFLQFLRLCLDNHMHKGSQISYIDFNEYNNDYSLLRNFIASRPDINYKQHTIAVSGPKKGSGNPPIILTFTKK